MTGQHKPWAYIAHHDGAWIAIMSAELPKKELQADLGRHVLEGLTVTTVYSREEYLAVLGTLKMWKGWDK